MELTGSVKEIFEAQDITPSFKKRELVLTTEERYPQHILIEFVQDKTSELDSLNKGDKVTVSINLRGREWTSPQGETKYFNSIQGWRVQPAGAANNGGSSSESTTTTPPPAPPMPEQNDWTDKLDDDDGLPF